MALYKGEKAFDAEIHIDLRTGNIIMDYSKNAISSPNDSNRSCELLNEFKKLPRSKRFIEISKRFPILLFRISYQLTTWIITFCFRHSIIKSPQWQIEHQKLMKYVYENSSASYWEIKEGPLLTNALRFPMNNNLWMRYSLEGEYKEKVTSISLERRFITRKLFGVYAQIIQRGWDLTFEFDGIPRSGKCVIEHT